MEKLFSGFPALSLGDWKKNVERDLEGITFEQLCFTDDNGLKVQPYYNRENSERSLFPQNKKAGWNICAMVEAESDAASNKLALEELNSGADALLFVTSDNADPAVLLEGISLPHIRSHFLCLSSPEKFPGLFREFCAKKMFPLSEIRGSFIFDPVSVAVRGNETNVEEDLRSWIRFAQHDLFKEVASTPLFADGFVYHSAGANSVTELACILAHLNEYLHLLAENKVGLNEKEVLVTSSCPTNFFESVSKFRALRKLIVFLLAQYSRKNPVFLHVANSLINKTAADQFNNLIRSGIEGMAAVAGNVDSITLWPYDFVTGQKSADARRWAINQQLIFKEESFLDKVTDIPAGSFYIEQRTKEIAEAAWEEFKQIEKEGGLLASLKKNFIQNKISGQAERAAGEFADGNKILVGVNKFANPKDDPAPRTFDPPSPGKGLGFLIAENSIRQKSQTPQV
jgi:methylmalonyl-CoA mutase